MNNNTFGRLDFQHKIVYLIVLLFVFISLGYTTITPIVRDWQNNQPSVGANNHAKIQAVLVIQHPTIQKIEHNAKPSTQSQFINRIGNASVKDFKRDKNNQIAPSITIAQAIVESAWGQSGLYQSANNVFGIKGAYHGMSSKFLTREVYNGNSVMVHANFRKYPNIEDSIEDHNILLRNQFIGKNHAMNYKSDAKLLVKHGYATDPNYAKTLIATIQTYNLNRFDKEAVK